MEKIMLQDDSPVENDSHEEDMDDPLIEPITRDFAYDAAAIAQFPAKLEALAQKVHFLKLLFPLK